MISATIKTSNGKKVTVGDILLVRALDHTTMGRWQNVMTAGKETPSTVEFIGRFVNVDNQALRLHSRSAGADDPKEYAVESIGELAIIPRGTVTYIGRLSGDPKRPRRTASKNRSRAS